MHAQILLVGPLRIQTLQTLLPTHAGLPALRQSATHLHPLLWVGLTEGVPPWEFPCWGALRRTCTLLSCARCTARCHWPTGTFPYVLHAHGLPMGHLRTQMLQT